MKESNPTSPPFSKEPEINTSYTEVEDSKTEIFDDVEIAQMNSLNEVSFLIKRHQEAMGREQRETEGFDGVHCIECEDKLIPQRLAIGAIRCVSCQNDHDKREKMRKINGRA